MCFIYLYHMFDAFYYVFCSLCYAVKFLFTSLLNRDNTDQHCYIGRCNATDVMSIGRLAEADLQPCPWLG